MTEEINKAVKILKEGGIILYPTDTVWGLGCDATNAQAVEKIYMIKKRSSSKSMIILIEDELKLNKYVKEVPEVAWELIENTDKPLTIIYQNACNLAKNVIAEDGSIAIRLVKDEFCQKLINRLGKPLVSTSANISGEETPVNFHKINPEIFEKVDYIVNWRQEEMTRGASSPIIQLSVNGDVKIIRK